MSIINMGRCFSSQCDGHGCLGIYVATMMVIDRGV